MLRDYGLGGDDELTFQQPTGTAPGTRPVVATSVTSSVSRATVTPGTYVRKIKVEKPVEQKLLQSVPGVSWGTVAMSVPAYALPAAKFLKDPAGETFEKAAPFFTSISRGKALTQEEEDALEDTAQVAAHAPVISAGLDRINAGIRYSIASVVESALASKAAQKVGSSFATRLIEGATKISPVVSKFAGPLEAAKGYWYMAKSGHELYKTGEAMKEAGAQADISEAAAAHAQAMARRGEGALRSQRALEEALPGAMRRLEVERENREFEARHLQLEIADLEKRQSDLIPQGMLLGPAETRKLYDMRQARDSALIRMDAAANELYRIQLMPMAQRLQWLSEKTLAQGRQP